MNLQEQRRLEALCADISASHREFADQYMLDFNGSQAVMRCRGFDCTLATARPMASGLLDREDVQAYLQLRQAQLSAEAGLSVIRILKRLEILAFANIGDYLESASDGQIRLKDLNAMPQESLAAVKKFKCCRTINGAGDEEYRAEIEMKDDISALKLLFVYMGLDDKVETAQRTLKRLQRTQDL